MLALGIAVALHLMTIWNLDLAARQQLASLRIEAGAIALTAMPPRVPDNDNAALFYKQAYVSLSTAIRNRITEQHEKGLNDIDVTPWVKWLDSGVQGTSWISISMTPTSHFFTETIRHDFIDI